MRKEIFMDENSNEYIKAKLEALARNSCDLLKLVEYWESIPKTKRKEILPMFEGSLHESLVSAIVTKRVKENTERAYAHNAAEKERATNKRAFMDIRFVGRPNRSTIIGTDDIINLKIVLNIATSLEEFLKEI